jgi:hypothetical protein
MTIKTIYIDDLPAGSNDLGSRAGFVQRLSYRKYFNIFLNNYLLNKNDFFDSRGADLNYGKSNNNSTIHLLESNLKNIDSTDSKAFNFVVDAYENFKFLIQQTEFSANSSLNELKNIQINNSFTNIHEKYHNHMTNLYVSYVDFSKIMKKNRKIIDFKSFLNNFVNFITIISDKTPILKSSYMQSREITVINTGFAIELQDTKKDQDEEKFAKYYNSPDFITYYNIAQKTGFKIDIDCPWRIIFDINNENSQKYMEKYNVNKNNILTQNFIKTSDYDLENLKLYTIMFYNSYVNLEKTVSSPVIINNNNVSILTNNLTERKKITLQQIDTVVRRDYWFKLFFYIKLLENNVFLIQDSFDSESKNCLNIYNKTGFNEALSYLNNLINKSEKTDKKLFYFV